jgi:hypothetical protein
VCSFVDVESVDGDVEVICKAFKNCKIERSYFERLCHLAKTGERLDKVQSLAETIWEKAREHAPDVIHSFIDWAIEFIDKEMIWGETSRAIAAALQVRRNYPKHSLGAIVLNITRFLLIALLISSQIGRRQNFGAVRL